MQVQERPELPECEVGFRLFFLAPRQPTTNLPVPHGRDAHSDPLCFLPRRVPPSVRGEPVTRATWPGFLNGGLLLPLPGAWFVPAAAHLQWQALKFGVKHEYHVTLLNQAVAGRLRAALGDAQVRRCFEAQDWEIARTGDGTLLCKEPTGQGSPVACASVIEHIELPALRQFREALARAAGMEVPSVPAHVTLYAAGDAGGIGLPDHASLRRMQAATFRLPGIANRAAPPLKPQQRAAYCAANYALDALATSVRIGNHCPIVDAELERRNVTRAAVVTAFNPFSARADAPGNELRQQWLAAFLKGEGLEVADAEGRDPDGGWSPEPSLLVFGTTQALEERLMRDFEQHAVVVVERGVPARLALHPDAMPRCT